jgi:hypothetical protein
MASVNGSADGRSTAELVQQASEQVSRLVRDELALAKSELAAKGRHAGVGAGLFGGGGLVALYGVGALVLAAIAGLAEAVPAWLSALIIGVVLLAVAAVMALLGRRQVRQAVPPMPKAATDGVREDIATVRTAVRERGRP